MTSEEAVQQVKKRVEIGDAEAMHNLGGIFSEGMYGMRQDMNKALELLVTVKPICPLGVLMILVKG